MKKQLLTIAMVTMLLVATLAGAANAATISASKLANEATTVTMKMDKPQQSITITLEYDPTIFEVDKTVGKDGVTTNGNADDRTLMVNSDEKGVVYISVSGTKAVVDEINVAFKLVEGTLDLPTEQEIVGSFEVTNVADIDEEFADTQVKVLVKEAGEPTPTQKPTSKPTDSVKPTDKVNPTKTPSGKPGTLVQTGAPVYVAGIAVIVVAAFVLMVRKAK